MRIAVSCWQHLLVAIPCKIYMFGMKATFLFTDNTALCSQLFLFTKVKCAWCGLSSESLICNDSINVNLTFLVIMISDSQFIICFSHS